MSLIRIVRYEQRKKDTYRIIEYFLSGQKARMPIFAGIQMKVEEEKLSSLSDNKVICIYCGDKTDYSHCDYGIGSNGQTWWYCYYCQECEKKTVIERNDKHWDYEKLEKELAKR